MPTASRNILADGGDTGPLVPKAAAALILAAAEAYEAEAARIPFRAQAAFEARDWPELVRLSRYRLALYPDCARALVPALRTRCPGPADPTFWTATEDAFVAAIARRYEADLFFAFFHSTRRLAYENVWQPLAYGSGTGTPGERDAAAIIGRIAATVPVRPPQVREILSAGGFAGAWRDMAADARLVGLEITRRLLRHGFADGEPLSVEMVQAGFFRNRGACLVGRIVADGHPPIPLLVAILNGRDGLFVDAVLTDGDEVQGVFSSTLANFHVTSRRYHELAAFLHGLMPKRPLGTHYSTIGFNHVGKAAVMNEILDEHRGGGERFDTAPGFRGTVAIGFAMPASRYVLKIIRDRPTAGYKWGAFAGVGSVFDKYRFVHISDRAGSMLDNIIYTNVALDRAMFDAALLDELVAEAPGSISLSDESVRFRHLIVQVRLTPLPLYLETADEEAALRAVVGLGDCIKNNAAANVFNKDLDARNYGMSATGRVYLFDYDAVEPLTEVKVRTNLGREEGEETVPDWFYESGTVFLPEETLVGLRLDDPALRRAFRTAHPELMTTDYWEGMQRALREGKVPKVRSYPPSRRLRRHVLGGG
jgi:isocitrate dehydrogenase kinase/phosphatase